MIKRKKLTDKDLENGLFAALAFSMRKYENRLLITRDFKLKPMGEEVDVRIINKHEKYMLPPSNISTNSSRISSEAASFAALMLSVSKFKNMLT